MPAKKKAKKSAVKKAATKKKVTKKKTAKKAAKKKTAKKTSKIAAIFKKRKPEEPVAVEPPAEPAVEKPPEKPKKEKLGIDCEHCDATGICAAGTPYDKSRGQTFGAKIRMTSCVDCLLAAGEHRNSKKLVDCRLCDGDGKV
jgi:hypothetical protein